MRRILYMMALALSLAGSARAYTVNDTLNTREIKLINTRGDTVRLVVSFRNDTLLFHANCAVFYFDTTLAYAKPHGFMTFDSLASVITIGAANSYVKISNVGNNLFTVGEARNITRAGDTAIIKVAGDYTVDWKFTFSGSNGNDYYVRCLHNGNPAIGRKGVTATGVANYAEVVGTSYVVSAVVGDHIQLQIKNQSAGNNATMRDGYVNITKETH